MSDIAIRRDISAPAKQTWAIFSEVSNYEHWNPFLVKAAGTPRLNSRLEMTAHTSAGGDVRFSPKIVELDRGRRLVWTTGLSIPGVFTRKVEFDVESTGDSSCIFTITVAPNGVLVPFRRGFVNGLEAGYTHMLDELKVRAERAEQAVQEPEA